MGSKCCSSSCCEDEKTETTMENTHAETREFEYKEEKQVLYVKNDENEVSYQPKLEKPEKPKKKIMKEFDENTVLSKFTIIFWVLY